MAEKDSIRVRTRLLKTGNKSIYLDIYRNGKRKYEFLKLYLVPDKGKAAKDKNKQTMQLAEAIKAKRLVSMQNHEFGFKDLHKKHVLFYDYYEAMCEKRLGSKGNWGNWRGCLKHMLMYCPDRKLKFEDVTPEWIEGFKHYLDTEATCWSGHCGLTKSLKPLAINSKQGYFNKFRAAINQAFLDRVIKSNPLRGIETFKGEEGHRLYLTFEELQLMAATECRHECVKQTFLFSCLTGLRRSDIEKMTWSEVHQQGDFTRIIFKQKKTKGVEYLDITEQAAELMGERRGPNDLVFPDFLTIGATNMAIKLWATKAGVEKDLTFHCGRHTFATLMLDLDTDIYTVSKLLGHREIKTTQIYAKVMDKNKQAAVAKIPSIFSKAKDEDTE